MLTIPQKEVIERWDKLPYSIREAIFSEENADMLENIAQAHNFDEEKLRVFSTNVGDVLRGFIHPNDLTKELIDDLKIKEEIAKAIVSEIESKIFKPVRVDLKDVYKPLVNTSEVNATVSVSQEYQGEPIKPRVNVQNEETTRLQNQPFILHNEEEVEPTKEEPFRSVTQRPMFYKPIFSEEYKKSVLEKKAARIELGEETEKKKQSESFKTPMKEGRIVHYSEFRTPLGPFENQEIRGLDQTAPEKAPQSVQSKTPEVHPNNVVDLKDLPLE